MKIKDDELKSFLESDVAVLVGTCDAECVPSITRGWAARVTKDGAEVQVFVSGAESKRTVENLLYNVRISATFSHPDTFRTVQVKGSCFLIEEANGDDLTAIERYQDAFLATVSRYGLKPEAISKIWGPEPLRLTIQPEFLFDQTPGPGAGRPL